MVRITWEDMMLGSVTKLPIFALAIALAAPSTIWAQDAQLAGEAGAALTAWQNIETDGRAAVTALSEAQSLLDRALAVRMRGQAQLEAAADQVARAAEQSAGDHQRKSEAEAVLSAAAAAHRAASVDHARLVSADIDAAWSVVALSADADNKRSEANAATATAAADQMRLAEAIEAAGTAADDLEAANAMARQKEQAVEDGLTLIQQIAGSESATEADKELGRSIEATVRRQAAEATARAAEALSTRDAAQLELEQAGLAARESTSTSSALNAASRQAGIALAEARDAAGRAGEARMAAAEALGLAETAHMAAEEELAAAEAAVTASDAQRATAQMVLDEARQLIEALNRALPSINEERAEALSETASGG